MKNVIKSIQEKFHNDAKSEIIDSLLNERIVYIDNRRRKILNLYKGSDEHNYFSSFENL